ncbi:MAG TPA: hypothetical protein EYN16_02475, partial [Flavobacteriaceae bacterium]|nr:hypothetical protein [Flavobacteriaceae bacterium]
MKLPKLYKSNLLLKASSLNFVLVAVKVIAGLVSSKITALLLGPSGLALLGNLKNFLQTSSSFTAEGYQNGIIKYTAEYNEDKQQLNKFVVSIFQLSLFLSVIIGLVVFLTSEYWAVSILKDKNFNYVFEVFAFSLPFFSFNLLYIYVLNGLQKFKKLVFINSLLSLLNMAILVWSVYYFQLSGALIATIASGVIIFFINLFFLKDDKFIIEQLFDFRRFSFLEIKKLSG